MDKQPTELLEIAFKQLSSIQDIIKCSKTCLRWYQIIEKLFKDKSTMSSNHPLKKEFIFAVYYWSNSFLTKSQIHIISNNSLYRKDINFIRKGLGRKAIHWQSSDNRSNRSKIELCIRQQTSWKTWPSWRSHWKYPSNLWWP